MISKNGAKLLCKIVWEDTVNDKKLDIDDWIKTTFNTKFNGLEDHISNYITKKDTEELCRIAWWDARANRDTYETVQKWFDKDFLTIIKRIKKHIK